VGQSPRPGPLCATSVLGTQGDPARGEEHTFHLTVMAGHLRVMSEFLNDLAEAAEEASDAASRDTNISR
jgi:hypothetical protein